MYARLVNRDQPSPQSNSSPNRQRANVTFLESNAGHAANPFAKDQDAEQEQGDNQHVERAHQASHLLDEEEDGFGMPAHLEVPTATSQQFFNHMPSLEQLSYLQRRFTTIRTQRDTVAERQHHMKGSNAIKILNMLGEGKSGGSKRNSEMSTLLQDHFAELEAEKQAEESHLQSMQEQQRKKDRLEKGLSRGAAEYLVTFSSPLKGAVVAESQPGNANAHATVVQANTVLSQAEATTATAFLNKMKATRKQLIDAKVAAIAGGPLRGTNTDLNNTITHFATKLSTRIERLTSGKQVEGVRSFGRSFSADRITFRTQTECKGHIADYEELLEDHKEVLKILNGAAPSLRERHLEDVIRKLTSQNKNQLALIRGLREKLTLVKKSPTLASLVLGCDLTGYVTTSNQHPPRALQHQQSGTFVVGSNSSSPHLQIQPPTQQQTTIPPPTTTSAPSTTTTASPSLPSSTPQRMLTSMVVVVNSLAYLSAVSSAVTLTSLSLLRQTAFGAKIPDLTTAAPTQLPSTSTASGRSGSRAVRRTSITSQHNNPHHGGGTTTDTGIKRSLLEVCNGEVVAMTCTPCAERYQLVFETPNDAILFSTLFHYLLTLQAWSPALKEFPETATQLVSSQGGGAGGLQESSGTHDHPSSRRVSSSIEPNNHNNSRQQQQQSSSSGITHAPPAYIWNGLRVGIGIEVGCGVSIEPLLVDIGGGIKGGDSTMMSTNISSNNTIADSCAVDEILKFAPQYRHLIDGPEVEVAGALAELAAGGETLITSTVAKALTDFNLSEITRRAYVIANRYLGVNVENNQQKAILEVTATSSSSTSHHAQKRRLSLNASASVSSPVGSAGGHSNNNAMLGAEAIPGRLSARQDGPLSSNHHHLLRSSTMESISGNDDLSVSSSTPRTNNNTQKSPRGQHHSLSANRHHHGGGGTISTLLRPIVDHNTIQQQQPLVSEDVVRVLYSAWGTIKTASDTGTGGAGAGNGPTNQLCIASSGTSSILSNRPSATRPLTILSVFSEQFKFRSFFLQRDLSQSEKTANPHFNGLSGPEVVFGAREDNAHDKSAQSQSMEGGLEGGSFTDSTLGGIIGIGGDEEDEVSVIDDVIYKVCKSTSTKKSHDGSGGARVDQVPLVPPPILPYQFDPTKLQSETSTTFNTGTRKSASSINSIGSLSIKGPTAATSLYIVAIKVAGLDDLAASLPLESAQRVVAAVKRIIHTYVTGLAKVRRGYLSRVVGGGSIYHLLFEDAIWALRFVMEIQECMIHHPSWPTELNLPPPPTPSADDLSSERHNGGSAAHSPHNVSTSSLATSPKSMTNTTTNNPLTFGFAGICPSPYFEEVVVGGDLIFRGPRLQIALLQTKPTTAPTPSVFQNASSKAASFGLSPNGQLFASKDNNTSNNINNNTIDSSTLSTNNYNSGALRSYLDPVSLRRIYLGDDVFMCSLVAANAQPGEVLIDTSVASMVERNAENLGYPETGLPVDICVPNRDGLRPQVQLFHRKRSLRGPFLRPDLYQATTATYNSGGGGVGGASSTTTTAPLLSPKGSMHRVRNAISTPSSVLRKRLMTPDDGGDSLNNTAGSLNITQRGGSKSSLLLPDDSVLSRLFTTMKILRRRVKDGNAHASRLEAVIGAKDLLLKDIRKDVLKRAHFELSYPETIEKLLKEDHTAALFSPTNAPQKAAVFPTTMSKGAIKPIEITASELLKMSLVSGTKMTFMAITFAHSDILLNKLPKDDIGHALSVWDSIITSCLRESDGVEVIRRPSGIVRVVCFPADQSLSCLSFWTEVCRRLVKAADWPPRLDETVEAGMMAMRDVLSVSGTFTQKTRGEGGLGGGRASVDDSSAASSMMAASNRFVDMDEVIWRGLRPVASIVHDTPAVSFNPCSHEYEISCGEGLSNPNGLLPVLPGDGVVDQLASLLDLCDEGECLISEPAEDMFVRAKSALKYPKITFDAYGPIYRVVLKEFKARNRFKVTFPVTFVPHVTSFFDFATRYRPQGFDPTVTSSTHHATKDPKSQAMHISPNSITNADDNSDNDQPVEVMPQLAASFTKAALSTDVAEGGDLSVAIVHVLAPQLLSGVNNPFKTSASAPPPSSSSANNAAQDTTPNSDTHATPPGAASLEVSGTMDKFVLPKRPSLLIDVSHPTALDPANNVASAAVTILETALQDALRTYQKCVAELIHENNGKIISVDNYECPTEWSVVFAVPIQGLAFSVSLHRTLLNCPWSRLLLRQPAFREILKNDTTVMKGVKARIGVHKVPSLLTAMHPITGVEVYDNCELGVACALAHNAHDGETYCSEAAHEVMVDARRRSQDVDLKVYSDNIARMTMVSAAHPALRATRPISVYQFIPVELQFRAALFIQEDHISLTSSSKGGSSLTKMKTQAQKDSDRREEIAKAIEEDSEFLTTVELTMNPIEHPVYKNSHQNGHIVSQLAYHKKRALTCEKTLALLESVNMMSQENIQHPYTNEAPRRHSVVTGQRLKNRKGFPPHMQLVLRELETSPSIAKDVLFDRRYAAELIYGKGLGADGDDDDVSENSEHIDDNDTNASTINTTKIALDSTANSTILGVRAAGRSKKNNTSHASLLNSSPIRKEVDEDVASSHKGGGGGGASPNPKGEAPEPTRISKIRQAVQPEDLVQLHIDVDRFTNLMLLHGPNGHMVRTWLESYPEFIAPDGNTSTTTPSHAAGGGMTPTHFNHGDDDALLSPSSASEAKDLRRLRVLTSMKTPVGMDMETMNFDKMRHSVIANLSLLLYRLANPNDPNSEGYNYRENMFAAVDGGGVGRSGSKPRKKAHK